MRTILKFFSTLFVFLVLVAVSTKWTSAATVIGETPVTRNVFLLIFNPILESKGSVKLTSYKKWYNPDSLTTSAMNSLNSDSFGYITYMISARQEVDGIFPKPDGYQYTDASYLACIGGTGPCHSPDIINYQALFSTYDICSKDVDEVWLWGGPYFGYLEYNPVAYCGKTQFVMGFSYERSLAEVLHDFGHRMEYVGNLRVGTGNWQQDESNEWNKFSLISKHCGNVHYPPGTIVGKEEYKYNKTAHITSDCNSYLNYPNAPVSPQQINCNAWGCTQKGYMNWWLKRVPHNSGTTVKTGKTLYNNWWKYFIFFDETYTPAEFNITQPTEMAYPYPAKFYFSYSAYTTNFVIDASTLPDMSNDVYLTFAQGSESPITLTNPTKWDKYTCGRMLYWRIYNADKTVKSSIQKTTITCN